MSEVLSCFDPAANPEAMLPVEESITRILAQVHCTLPIERVALADAVGRVLAEEQRSLLNVPAVTNSAMDGYAVRAAAFTDGSAPVLRVTGCVFAGQAFAGEVAAGEAVEIMTGAPVPKGADSIVIREAAERDGDQLRFIGPVKIGQHVRQAGEDIAAGAVALTEGVMLQPQHAGLLASLGLSEVPVYRPLTVAVFSTGDEVTAQGQALPENCIYDTNRFTLQGLLKRIGCRVIDLGIIDDNQSAMERTLSNAAQQADMVISSGGVSMGEADFIKKALSAVGQINFWRIAMRPGRPLAFGTINDTPFFGLPGNPVAVMVTFLQFVQPALRKMMGQKDWQPTRMTAVAETTLKSRLHRTDYSRGVYRIDEQGQLVVRSTGAQGSGILTSMVQANCLIEIGDDHGHIDAGQRVTIQPFGELV